MLRRARAFVASHRMLDITLLVLITLLAARGWLNLDLPRGHDVVGDMLLAQAGAQTLSLDHLLSGWSSEWYLGCPIFVVHAPLVSFLIRALSPILGWVLGLKLLYLSFYSLSGVFAYWYVHELTRNRPAAFAAGLAYVFLPYHVLEMAFEGHHGAFGLPYMLAPLLLLCLDRLVRRPGMKLLFINALLLTALVLTYPQVFPILVGPLLVAYVTVRIWWERRQGRAYIRRAALISMAAFCLPLLLTAFWWLPLASEIGNFSATSFPLDTARGYSATFWQAVSLRPSFCCSPDSAWGASGSAFLELFRLLPFALVVLGFILSRRNKYAWFFAASILLATLLSMGPDSPIPLFSLAHRVIPFFSGLRTPWRYMLVSSVAYAVLIGFCVQGATEWWERRHPQKPGRLGAGALVLLLVCLIVSGNTWAETRRALTTFTLSEDQQHAFEWLKAQSDGDYRITDLPFQAWTSSERTGTLMNPVYWTYLHSRDNVYGGVPAAAVKYASDTLEYLNLSLVNGSDVSRWLSLFNVRYVLIDKSDPASEGVALGEGFDLAWTSATIEVYESRDIGPRIFLVTTGDRRDIPLWTDDRINVLRAVNSQPVDLSLSSAHTLSSSVALEARFQFSEPEAEWSGLGADISGIALDADDAVRLAVYSEQAQPGLSITFHVLESDGSRYGFELNRVDGIEAGWNEVEFPFSLMVPTEATADRQLHLDQVISLWFGIAETDETRGSREFSLYFDSLSLVSQKNIGDVSYTRTAPGEYQVHVDASSPVRLVLSESYHPYWVARLNGATIQSEMAYASLNSFELPAGEYDVALEYVPSPQRTTGAIISGVGLLALLLGCALRLGTKYRYGGSRPAADTVHCLWPRFWAKIGGRCGPAAHRKMTENKLLTVVIPALNEEQGIEQTIRAVPRDAIRRLGYEVQVLVVDNGSTDRTAELARRAGADVVPQPVRGYGSALRKGFAAAAGDVIVTADADATYPLEAIPSLLETLDRENLDFLSTNRLPSLDPSAMPSLNRAGNRLLAATTRALFGIRLADPESGMWLLRKDLLPRLTLHSDSWPLSHEIKIEACYYSGCRWKEAPIPYRPRVGQTKLSSAWKVGIIDLLHIAKKRVVR